MRTSPIVIISGLFNGTFSYYNNVKGAAVNLTAQYDSMWMISIEKATGPGHGVIVAPTRPGGNIPMVRNLRPWYSPNDGFVAAFNLNSDKYWTRGTNPGFNTNERERPNSTLSGTTYAYATIIKCNALLECGNLYELDGTIITDIDTDVNVLTFIVSALMVPLIAAIAYSSCPNVNIRRATGEDGQRPFVFGFTTESSPSPIKQDWGTYHIALNGTALGTGGGVCYDPATKGGAFVGGFSGASEWGWGNSSCGQSVLENRASGVLDPFVTRGILEQRGGRRGGPSHRTRARSWTRRTGTFKSLTRSCS